jgi:hypothetical protein
MKQFLMAAAALAAVAASASTSSGQTYRDIAGTLVPGVIPLPTPYAPLSPGQYGLAPTSATALTVPSGARYATVCAETATVRYTTDGRTAPSSGVGMPLAAGACVTLSGPQALANFLAFSASGKLDVEYFQ